MSKSNLKIAIGLMSGTSLDGIDIALVVTDGEDIVERGPAMGVPYDAAFRAVLAQALETAKAIDERSQRPGNLAEVERELTLRHAAAVAAFLDKFGIAADKVDYIGFHGQTVLHRPLHGLTVQLGDGALLARQTGISVVYDMRANDMVHGGQGAPLVPAYHAALAAGIPEFVGDAVMFVNIGGISNVTYIGPKGDILAFDSGPGNTLIDQWVEAEAGMAYDNGGKLAASGEVIWPLVNSYLDHPFFTSNKRMSLDRNDFRPPAAGSASLQDGAATLSFVTAAAINQSIRHLPEPPALFIVCGGGRLNKAIMGHLNVHTRARVEPAETFGFNGDSMEAEAWAYLAVRSSRGLPLTFPGTTDVSEPVTGGVLAPKPFLVTDRLAIYPWDEGDAAHVADLHSTLETSRYMSTGAPWTEAYAVTRIDAWMADLARHGITKFKLVSRDDGHFIGRAGFSWMEERQAFELGYAIRREDWGQGYATEIADGLARWFLATRPEPYFLAFAYQGNKASIHILEKIGMTEIDGQDLPLGRARFFEMVRG